MDDLKLVGLGLAWNLGYLAALLLISLLLAKLADRRRRRLSPLSQALGEASRIRGRMTRMARPTLLLTPTKQPGFSKMGGEPELPADVAWPTGEGVSLAFLTQVDLTELRAADGPIGCPMKAASTPSTTMRASVSPTLSASSIALRLRARPHPILSTFRPSFGFPSAAQGSCGFDRSRASIGWASMFAS